MTTDAALLAELGAVLDRVDPVPQHVIDQAQHAYYRTRVTPLVRHTHPDGGDGGSGGVTA